MQVKKKKTRVWLWVLLAVVVTIVVVLILVSSAITRAAQPVYVAHTIEAGTVERTITGSGRLAAADDQTLQLPGGALVASVPIKAGDNVKAGDVLAIMDVDSLRDLSAQASKQVSSLDREIDSRSKVTQIKAPVRGRIKYLPAKEGDDVLSVIREHGFLALISSDEKMQVSLETTAELALHSEVTVRWDGGEATGMVFEKSLSGYIITLKDNAAPYLANAQVYDGDKLLGQGALEIHAPVAVLANGGEITNVDAKENDMVYANHKLFSIENAPAGASYNEAFAERTEKAALYAQLLSYLQDPRVLAPADGIVSEVMVSSNTDVPAATDTSGLSDAFVLLTGGAVKLSVDVDELDIDAVALGQSANVTLDAYPGETFEATVTHISRIGTTTGSITTYPVEVTLSYDERLLEGMNGSAVILIATAENVPLLPVELISEDSAGEYVNVKTASGELVRRDIVTGLSDGVNAQITSGLVAGDEIWSLDTSGNAEFAAMMARRNSYAEKNGYPTIGGNRSSRAVNPSSP